MKQVTLIFFIFIYVTSCSSGKFEQETVVTDTVVVKEEMAASEPATPDSLNPATQAKQLFDVKNYDGAEERFFVQLKSENAIKIDTVKARFIQERSGDHYYSGYLVANDALVYYINRKDPLQSSYFLPGVPHDKNAFVFKKDTIIQNGSHTDTVYFFEQDYQVLERQALVCWTPRFGIFFSVPWSWPVVNMVQTKDGETNDSIKFLVYSIFRNQDVYKRRMLEVLIGKK